MKILQDCFGRKVRLTDERRVHILEHPEKQTFGGGNCAGFAAATIRAAFTRGRGGEIIPRILRADNCGWQMALRYG